MKFPLEGTLCLLSKYAVERARPRSSALPLAACLKSAPPVKFNYWVLHLYPSHEDSGG